MSVYSSPLYHRLSADTIKLPYDYHIGTVVVFLPHKAALPPRQWNVVHGIYTVRPERSHAASVFRKPIRTELPSPLPNQTVLPRKERKKGVAHQYVLSRYYLHRQLPRNSDSTLEVGTWAGRGDRQCRLTPNTKLGRDGHPERRGGGEGQTVGRARRGTLLAGNKEGERQKRPRGLNPNDGLEISQECELT
ncbi:hypothetical protein J6590_016934 [Homalodisca vitripennis]|nr:hypothetical protein J6590_016934 [Homalodisca vitripennis]